MNLLKNLNMYKTLFALLFAVTLAGRVDADDQNPEKKKPLKKEQRADQPLQRQDQPQRSQRVQKQQQQQQQQQAQQPSQKQVHPDRQPVPKQVPRVPVQAREDVKKFMQSKKMDFRNRPLTREQQAFKDSLPKRIERDRGAAKVVRSRMSRDRFARTFNESFFRRHNFYPSYYRPGINWWRPYPWVTINNWLGWGWTSPIYFDDFGYPIQMMRDLSPFQQPLEQDWLPIGVFVLARNVNEAAFSSQFVQLALNRAGDLAGTYYNASNDELHALAGYIDRDTQQAVWKVSDSPNLPIVSTGLYNLTQDAATVQIYFPDGTQQSWVLVKLSI